MIATAAMAQTTPLRLWNSDAQSRFTFSAPPEWPVDKLSQPNASVTEYEAGFADAACKFYVIERPNQASQAPDVWLRANNSVISTEKWNEVLLPFPAFRNGAVVENPTFDNSAFWPRQKAMVTTPDAKINAAIATRPGLEVWTFCQSYDGKDRNALFDQIIGSVATPKDAELKAAAEAGEAARASRQAATSAANDDAANAAANAAAANEAQKQSQTKRPKGMRGGAR
jgi:hypothetical protein